MKLTKAKLISILKPKLKSLGFTYFKETGERGTTLYDYVADYCRSKIREK